MSHLKAIYSRQLTGRWTLMPKCVKGDNKYSYIYLVSIRFPVLSQLGLPQCDFEAPASVDLSNMSNVGEIHLPVRLRLLMLLRLQLWVMREADLYRCFKLHIEYRHEGKRINLLGSTVTPGKFCGLR